MFLKAQYTYKANYKQGHEDDKTTLGRETSKYEYKIETKITPTYNY